MADVLHGSNEDSSCLCFRREKTWSVLMFGEGCLGASDIPSKVLKSTKVSLKVRRIGQKRSTLLLTWVWALTFARQILGKDFCHLSTLSRKSFWGTVSIQERKFISAAGKRNLWSRNGNDLMDNFSSVKGRKESVRLDLTFLKLLQKAWMWQSNGVSQACTMLSGDAQAMAWGHDLAPQFCNCALAWLC